MRNFIECLEANSMNKEQCFGSLSNEDIYLLLVRFQNEKNNYFKKYIEYLDKQSDLEQTEIFLYKKYEEEKQKAWKWHLAYEDLIQYCFEENTKRIKKI